MRFYDTTEAKAEGLVPLTIWLRDNDNERAFLEKQKTQVMRNPKRKTMFVKKAGLIALFVDNAASRR